MSDLLGIGASGVLAYRSALSVTGDNLVNSETKGFARRTVAITEASVAGGAHPLYRVRSEQGGVNPVGVERAWNDYQASASRVAASAAGSSDARVRWLTTAETGLDDGNTGVGQRVTAVFNAGAALASDPGSTAQRGAFLVAIDGAATAFRTTATALQATSDALAGEAATTLDSINGTLKNLAEVNRALAKQDPSSSGWAQSADERDRLLDDLATKLDVGIVTNGNGTVQVSLGRGGPVLLGEVGTTPAGFSATQAADGRLAVQMTTDTGVATVFPASGAVAGLVDAASTIADRRNALDGMAQDFATGLNDWSKAGIDRTGAAGTDLLAFTAGAAAATIAPAVANRSPATVAAGRTGGAANANLLTLDTLRGDGGTEARWSQMVSQHSQILSAARSENTTVTARRDAAFADRDATSGVDLDKEASNLLRYQQAYNGSAKIIQVARETLQSILDIMR